MNHKELRNLWKYGTTVRLMFCKNCRLNKYIVPDENYNAYNVDVVSKCCEKPDYRI